MQIIHHDLFWCKGKLCSSFRQRKTCKYKCTKSITIMQQNNGITPIKLRPPGRKLYSFPTSLHHSWNIIFVIRNDTSIWYISWSETGWINSWRGRVHWNRDCIFISCTLAKILWFSVDSCEYKYANIWTIKIVVQGYLVSWFAYMTFPRIKAFQAVRYIYRVVYLWVRIHGSVCHRIWRRPWAVSYISSVSRFPANTI